MSYAVDHNACDELDLVVDAVIEAAGGDVRAALLDLVRRQHELEGAIERSVSAGYVRRMPSA